jgi:hypothetical protein
MADPKAPKPTDPSAPEVSDGSDSATSEVTVNFESDAPVVESDIDHSYHDVAPGVKGRVATDDEKAVRAVS